ncbi:HD domain-containing protein [Frigoriflavimonas asaccharolytica]|uniref:Putative metal-dependent HD superfamily phosphohydrolase n=1 Tax=Frigoriflavimonas asaccharolytica TaxID=2735899 RepID=A0A8J8K6U3_9FLAO|nr:HD domain-containing protein [Frigoriflavimonas asaccharolytica]NRS94125.1 putative metal-dependent HD superfamily phosphohydrolase [Frigoriflavimonas asaccharolytica]
MRYKELQSVIIDLLKEKLPEHLSYHSVAHITDVIESVDRIAKAENCTEEELILLKTAALFHDTGFIYGAKDHEQKSCEIAQSYLLDYGYNQAEIDQIKGMIMATKIPQTPGNHLEEIVADADLDYLGRDDFFIIGNKLFEELSMFGIINTEYDWNLLQEKFLENHHFFTKTAIETRNEKKNENLQIIKEKLKNETN